jgi:2-succinyl-5-enolpyruvyl-6-hydroxy-3-cyclohexene-1-carboxylate synthase
VQAIYDIPEILFQHGITDVVLSPGSRCAPLSIAFARHKKLAIKVIPDERSAAFIALGMSLKTQKPTVLICTSGSALYNYAPAIVEAYYQRVPLIVLTADRPPEWIDQNDGQTIQQQEIYGKHSKAFFQLSADHELPASQWETYRKVNEAIAISEAYPKGPVHINIPFREPFYPTGEIVFSESPTVIKREQPVHTFSDTQWKSIQSKLDSYKKILFVGGQTPYDESLRLKIGNIKAPFISEVISNLHGVRNAIHTHDTMLTSIPLADLEELKPDLVISFGGALLSKWLKKYIRSNNTIDHWYVGPDVTTPDVFQQLVEIIPVELTEFLAKTTIASTTQENYLQRWIQQQTHIIPAIRDFNTNERTFNEFSAVADVLQHLPSYTKLHLANSMSVRYANTIGVTQRTVEVFANRGTSGIDGVISTAFGYALKTNQLVTIITGDMAFFYDRNAFWNNYKPSNIRVVLLNNHGGGIFRMIDGPSSLPELDEFFETKQTLSAKHLAIEHGLEYIVCKNFNDLNKAIDEFFQPSMFGKILEIETDSSKNTEVFKRFKKTLQQFHSK